MRRFRMVFADGHEPITFQGGDATPAIALAHGHAGATELWEGDKHHCTLHECGGVWTVSRARIAYCPVGRLAAA